ncbi:MAG: N-acetylmuramoyl-L-alanine amidase [Nitrospirae bacterium]|nr:N-acetylmuramoyl-L-alanine amidase [Nitrospirota bacterium]
MKKCFLLSLVLFLLPSISRGDNYPLKLRTSYNPGFLRIVLEGSESIITKAVVSQKAQNILVSFPDADFTIQAEKAGVAYKTEKNTVMFSPGDFRGMKVLTLRNPDRVVIDVYQEEKNKEGNTPLTPLDRGEKISKTKTLIIDPGHGGFESGIVRGDYSEKKVVLDIAGKLGALAEKDGFRSYPTRGGDLFMTLAERVKYANSNNADMFISLHVGSNKEWVIYIPVITESVSDEAKPYLYGRGQGEYLKRTVALLNSVKEAAAAAFGSEMVTVRQLPYSALSKIEAAALMIELPSFEDASYTDEFDSKIADTLYKGLYLYEENEAK